MQPKKIFIVDDDSFLLDMYALKFSQASYDVTTALGALPALEKLRGGYVPDIILTDLVMPVVDGFEFLEKMRTENLAPNSVHIVLSNRGQEADIAHAKELGAAGFIVKASTTPSEVITQVADIVAKATPGGPTISVAPAMSVPAAAPAPVVTPTPAVAPQELPPAPPAAVPAAPSAVPPMPPTPPVPPAPAA